MGASEYLKNRAQQQRDSQQGKGAASDFLKNKASEQRKRQEEEKRASEKQEALSDRDGAVVREFLESLEAPEAPTSKKQPSFTWNVPVDPQTRHERYVAVSPGQFQQDQTLLRKYGGSYENYLNDNRRNFDSAAEYEETVARAQQYNSQQDLLTAQNRVTAAQQTGEEIANEGQRLQRSAENLQILLQRYQQSGSVVDGQAYLIAVDAHNQAVEAYNEKYAAYEKEWNTAQKGYETARAKAVKDQAGYLRAAERLQKTQEAQNAAAEKRAANHPAKKSSEELQKIIEEVDKQIVDLTEKGNLEMGEPEWDYFMPRNPYQDQIDQLTNEKAELSSYLYRAQTREWETEQEQAILAYGGMELMNALREYARLQAQDQQVNVFRGSDALLTTNKELVAAEQKIRDMGVSEQDFAEWTAYAQRMENAESSSYVQNMTANMAASGLGGAVAASALSVYQGMTGILGVADILGQTLVKGMTGSEIPVDYNTWTTHAAKAANAARSTVAEKIEKKTAGKVGSDTAFGNLYSNSYQLAMSMVDSLASGGATILLGGSAALSGIEDALERGANQWQALGVGLLYGAAEMVFEKISLDRLFETKDIKGWRDAIKNILKQGGVEASEEVFTTLANTLGDAIIMGNKSQLRTQVRALMDQGMSQGEAENAALLSWGIGLIGDAIGGAISGGLFGTGDSLINGDFSRNRTEEQTATASAEPHNDGDLGTGNVQAVGDLGKKEDAAPFKTGADVIGEPGGVTSSETSVDDSVSEINKNVIGITENVIGERERIATSPSAPRNDSVVEGIEWAGNRPAENMERMEQNGQAEQNQSGDAQRADLGNLDGRGAETAERTAASAAIRRAGEARRVQANVEALGGELTSLRAIGMAEGSDQEIIRVVPREAWTPEVEEAWNLAESEGLEFVPVIGSLYAKARSGKQIKFVSALQNGKIYAQADSLKQSIGEAVSHEIYHQKVAKDPTLQERVVRRIRETYTPEETDTMYERYYKEYQDTFDGKMTDEEIMDAVWEEMLADAYAEFQRYADTYGTAPWGEVVQDEVWSGGGERDADSGSATKFSVAELEGENRKYGPGVILDTDIFEGVSIRDWGKVLGNYVYNNLAGQEMTMYDAQGNPEIVHIAKQTDRVRKDGTKNNHKVLDELARYRGDNVKALATVHLSELLATSGNETTTNDKSHGWLDENGWRKRTFYAMTRNGKIYEGTLNIADGRNGLTVYKISAVHQVDTKKEGTPAAQVPASEEAARSTSRDPYGDRVAKKRKGVKTSFSVDTPVEQTKTLIALHNMDEEKLRRTLKLGSWPAPSVAIVKANQGHEKFGEYSAVFPRSTIDPEADYRNKVYGSDAWTPTHNNAQVEYEVNYDAKRAFEDKIERLSGKFAGGAFRNGSVIGSTGVDNETSMSLDEIARKLSKYPAVQAAYLQDRGDTLEPVYKKKNFDSFGNEALQSYIDSIGYQELARLDMELTLGNELPADVLEAARDIIMDEWVSKNEWRLKNKPELREKRIENQRKKLEDWRVRNFIEHAWEYYEEYGATTSEIDTSATASAMFDMILPDGAWDEVEKVVQDWVRPQLEGVLGEPGIYNGRDRITNNGRRSFRETHYPYSAENIVRAMYNQGSARGEELWGASAEGMVSVASPEYDSVAGIHADEGRLRTASEDEYDTVMRRLDSEIGGFIANSMEAMEAHSSNRYEEGDIIGYILLQAAGSHTVKDVQRVFRKEGYDLPTNLAKDALRIFQMAAETPTKYFEAKPQRVVGFEEALAVVAPDNAPVGLIDDMRRAGMNVLTYEAGNGESRLEKINSLDHARFSIDNEGGSNGEIREELEQIVKPEFNGKHSVSSEIKDEIMLKAGRELVQGQHVVPRKVVENTGDIIREDWMSDEVYDEINQKWKNRQHREARVLEGTDAIVPKRDFVSTPAMDKLGIKIDGSVTRYRRTAELRAFEKAAYQARKMVDRKIRELHPTDTELRLADDLIDGVLTPDALNSRVVNIDKIVELADYKMAARTFREDALYQRRSEINTANQQIAGELFRNTEAFKPKLKFLPKLTSLVMDYREMEALCYQVFGEEHGAKVYEAYFRPVWVNGCEMNRFETNMHKRIEAFEDQNKAKRQLTEEERNYAQRLLEAEAVEDAMGLLGAEQQERIKAAAKMLNDGKGMSAAASEMRLEDEYHQGLAQAYADYMDTLEVVAQADQTILRNAINAYKQLYNELYDAINDFLVSHGYPEIGFIKGYAPHFQKQEVQQGLFGAMRSLGVEKESVSALPTDIAGRTADFKPNMKWNPHAQTRRGKKTDYDILKGFEQYVHYAAEVFYHTDDVMRIRQAEKWFRKTFSGEEISAAIEDAKVDMYKSVDWKKRFLESKGILRRGAETEPRSVNAAYDHYVDELYKKAEPEKLREFSELAMWLDNYANIVAGKQSLADRGLEYGGGREALNLGSALTRMFARTNVGANLSSAFNQMAQLPTIQTELGWHMEEAVLDLVRGKVVKEGFAKESDFLTDKRGVETLTETNGEKILSMLFKPAELADRLTATIAVRGKYRQELAKGKTHEQAMREADDYGRRAMGSRMKGAKPLAFESKGPIRQMMHQFQIEAVRSFDRMITDAPRAYRRVLKERGKGAAARLAATKCTAFMMWTFALNSLTRFLYGGSPAPFDFLGWLLSFAAGLWDEEEGEFLKTIIDNVAETITGERPFETEELEKPVNGLDWAGAVDDLLYNLGDDVPIARNALQLMGYGDQSGPLAGVGELVGNLWAAGKTLTNQALKGEDVTGLDWAGAAGKAGTEATEAVLGIVPGGRQAKKTLQGIAAVAQGGAYSGFGENRSMRYPVEQNAWNAIRGALFGVSALKETEKYYAGQNSLTAAQTATMEKLETSGVDRFTTYELYQTFRNIGQRMDGIEEKTAKRNAIDELDLTDEQKLEVYLQTVIGDKNTESVRAKYQPLLDAGISWSQLTQLDNAYSWTNLDEDEDGEPDMSSLERGIAKRNAIDELDLTDEQKLEVFDRYHLDRESKNYETTRQEFEAMLGAGLTWSDITRAHNTYAELEADEELDAPQKATAYAKWADEQGWNGQQKTSVKERYTFWQMIPAEAKGYEKLTGAGLDSEAANTVTKVLGELEPEGDKKQVSDQQKIEAIVGAGLSYQDEVNAIGTLLSDNQKKYFDQLLEQGMSPEEYSQYRRAVEGLEADKDENGKSISGSKKEKVLAAIDSLPISDSMKDTLYFAEGYGEKGLKDAPWNQGGIMWAGR